MPFDALEYMKSLEKKYGMPVLDAAPLEGMGALLDGSKPGMYVYDDIEFAELAIGHDAASRLASVRVDLSRIGVYGSGKSVLGSEYIHDSWESGVFSKVFTGKWTAIDGVFVYMEIKDSVDSDAVYEIPVLIDGERRSLIVAHYRETGEYEILGTRPVLGESGMPSKDLRVLVPGDVIEPLYIFEDGDGSRSCVSSGVVAITDATRVETKELPDGMYYLTFALTDIKGSTYTSSAVKVVDHAMDMGIAKNVLSDAALVMGTSGIKGTYFPYGGAIAEVLMRRIDDLDIAVIPTSGSQSNLYSISRKDIDLRSNARWRRSYQARSCSKISWKKRASTCTISAANGWRKRASSCAAA